MSEDVEMLPAAERARVNSRDRKVRGPKVIVDNAGLKEIQLQLAGRRRAAAKQRRAGADGSPPT